MGRPFVRLRGSKCLKISALSLFLAKLPLSPPFVRHIHPTPFVKACWYPLGVNDPLGLGGWHFWDNWQKLDIILISHSRWDSCVLIWPHIFGAFFGRKSITIHKRAEPDDTLPCPQVSPHRFQTVKRAILRWGWTSFYWSIIVESMCWNYPTQSWNVSLFTAAFV